MKKELTDLLSAILKDLGVGDIDPEISISENPIHGEYTTNVALRLTKVLKKPPMDIALQVKDALDGHISSVSHDQPDQNLNRSGQKISADNKVFSVLQDIESVEVAPPGFINFKISEAKLSSRISEVLIEQDRRDTPQTNSAKQGKNRVMVEFAHPNTHKAFHIGHLRNISTGESIVRLLESRGIKVIRANYQGDVGLHIAKCLYAMRELPEYKNELPKVKNKSIKEKVEFLGKVYAAGSQEYEKDEKIKKIIHDYNFLIYASAAKFSVERGLPPISTDYLTFVKERKDELDEVYTLWIETRQWSLDYYESIYKRVYSRFDRLYFESECLSGVDYAKDAVKKGVLKESDGAIIFDGKPYGLDTRVFVNSLGLPTYEGKELALSTIQFSQYKGIEKLIHVVGPEQVSFFRVSFKAEELLGIQKGQQYHLVYGWVRLKHGKMSSRLGNVVTGEALLDEVKKEIYTILHKSDVKHKESKQSTTDLSHSIAKEQYRSAPDHTSLTTEEMEDVAEKATIAAVKYTFLKVGTLQDIAFDIKESVNLNGDSGPYLLYTYARCKSVISKSKGIAYKSQPATYTFNPEERALARLLLFFPDIVADAADNYSPNTICTYLFELAQAFNLFYAKHSILGTDNSPARNASQRDAGGQPTTYNRLRLTDATARILKNGLSLLGIETVERM